MNLWLQIGILIVSGFVLAWAANVVVAQAGFLAHKLGLTSFTIGFLILGIFTSMPEFFVALSAARDGIPALAVGTLLGGSILLLSFVMGVAALILGRVDLDRRLSFRELWVMAGVIASPIVVLWDGKLTRPDGLFLVGVYVLHAFLLDHQGQPKIKKLVRRGPMIHHILVLAGAVGLLFFSSRFIITSAEGIMSALHIAPIIFGLFLLSLGTNLPEFALAYESIIHRKREIAFGDFLGSSAANTLILGILGIVAPSAGGGGKLAGALLILGSVTLYFLWAISSGRTISRKEGVGLLVFYLLFIVYELFV